MRNVKQLWLTYARSTQVPNAIEWAEAKRAFYAGVLLTLTAIRDEFDIDNPEQGAKDLDALLSECQAFLGVLGQQVAS